MGLGFGQSEKDENGSPQEHGSKEKQQDDDVRDTQQNLDTYVCSQPIPQPQHTRTPKRPYVDEDDSESQQKRLCMNNTDHPDVQQHSTNQNGSTGTGNTSTSPEWNIPSGMLEREVQDSDGGGSDTDHTENASQPPQAPINEYESVMATSSPQQTNPSAYQDTDERILDLSPEEIIAALGLNGTIDIPGIPFYQEDSGEEMTEPEFFGEFIRYSTKFSG
ncbi:uncharacterized protein LOC121860949 [Homarus americanus]|uniref:Uncharacterized protein n=1 Tax=Homarus americanus TaxID=6706 RepID=A0A8J5TJB2_HOMAM|nr:uncharacterized protein LOC121860949 [Homarus americanus]XP_042214283.1 uncharacterized protein LOC121860949 [Homarus americanus]KAG7173042.1 hypothetical protein Hamer_G008563 [Homarus americanus]